MSEAARLDRFDGFGAPGEMAARIAAKDWSRTPLGPVSAWPQSLRTAASVCVDSGFPMLVCWGPDFVMLYNDGYIPVLGAKHPHALGQPLLECWSEIRDMLGPMFRGVVETGRALYANDLMFPLGRHGFTEECYFTFSYSPIRDESDRVGGVLVTCTETTQRVLGERRLRTLRDLATRASEAKTDVEAWHGAEKVLADDPFELPFAAFYSFDPDRTARRAGLCGLDPASPAAPERIDLERTASGWPVHQAASGKVEFVADVRRRFGVVKGPVWPEPVESAFVLPITRAALTRPYGALVVGVSPRLKLDDAYRSFLGLVAEHLATAIANARAHEEERKRAEVLAELDRAKTTFFGNVSHEFRTPLTLMLAPIEEMLRDNPRLAPQDREELAIVRRNGQRLLKLVNTLLDFSRIEAGRIEASFEPTDLAAVTGDLASVFRSAIERAGLELLVECEPLTVPVYVDRDMWEKIVFNLISNAFKFTLHGRIAVRLRRSGDMAELRVEDTGTGIPEHELPRLFERFHRVEGASGRTQEGTGIGLALVQELARLHGGSVRVESTLGKGSAFSVSLPLGSAHLPPGRIQAPRTQERTALGEGPFVEEALRWIQPASLDDPAGIGPSAAPVQGPDPVAALSRRARILLADDNADMRDYLRRLLEQQWLVETVADGDQALAATRARPPDLILSDVMMPRLDGFALLKALRADHATASIPVILISARAGEESQAEGRAAGADDYLVKPFSARELVARVQSQLALAALRRSEQLHRDDLRRLFMDAPAVLALVRGPDHVFELANEAYRRLVGDRDLIGLPARQALPEIQGQGYFELLDRVFETGEPYSGKEARVLVRRRAGGDLEECFFNFVYQPFRDLNGVIAGIVVFGFEVTELVHARQRTEVLAEQARDADRRKDEFLAMLGHELRNPLAPIATAVQLMKLRGYSRFDREREIIERQVAHLSRLVDDLLDVSRIARGKVELRRKTVELAEAVHKAVEIVSPLFEERRHHLSIEVPRQGLQLDADPVRLAQLFANLLSNAAKYTPQGGHIQVAAWRDGHEVLIRVKDDGVGISADLLPRIFDLFVQGRRAPDRAGGGLGLGLALVKSLVSLHGGSVTARSEGADRGSEFTIRLPLLRHAPANPENTPPRPTRAAARVARRVLVVDDNRDGAEMLAEALRMHGHDAVTAFDGAAALSLVQEQAFDVGILDLGLPVLDGYELARRIRSDARCPAMRLIALTGYGQEKDVAGSRAAGFDLHFVKPVELEAVLDALESLVEGGVSGVSDGALGGRDAADLGR